MFDLYPNVLMVACGSSSEVDVDGDVKEKNDGFSEVCICRAVRNGSAQQITLSGGTQYRYQYVVYMPCGVGRIKDGTPVKVYDGRDDTLVIQGLAHSFVASPVGCKMWI